MGFHDMMYGWSGGWAGWSMFLGMAIFWISVIGLGFWALKSTITAGVRPASQGPSGASDTAVDLLRRRYAAGEIEKDEFELKRRDLV